MKNSNPKKDNVVSLAEYSRLRDEVMSQSMPYIQRAGHILRNNFLSPEEVSEVFNFRSSISYLDYLYETIPTDIKVLMAIKSLGGLLIPGIYKDINLLDVRLLNDIKKSSLKFSDYCQSKSEEEKRFTVKSDVVKAKAWMIVCKRPIEDSTNKVWEEPKELIPYGKRIPNMAEALYVDIVYFQIHGIRLFKDLRIRTSSALDGDHCNICMSYFGGDLDLYGFYRSSISDSGKIYIWDYKV